MNAIKVTQFLLNGLEKISDSLRDGFVDTPLEGTNFNGAKLDGLLFKGTSQKLNMMYADLSGATLHSTRFKNVDLTGANFIGAEGITSETFKNCTLTRVKVDKKTANLLSETLSTEQQKQLVVLQNLFGKGK